VKEMEYSNRKIVGIAFEPDIFEAVEEGRGRANRSKFINSILKEKLGLPERPEVMNK
jgi:hypothetical protein